VRCVRLIADPPEDPVVVEAFCDVAERLAAFVDDPESVQPDELSLEGLVESPSLETLLSRCLQATARRTGSTRCRGS
jgi:hypothetical protein